MNNAYQCPAGTFKCPLKEELASYVQYKVNINGCRADSFIPKLKQFDSHCMDVVRKSECLKRGAVMGFLRLREGENRNNLASRAYVLQGFLGYMSAVLKVEGIYHFKLPKWRHGSYMPYIFTHKEIRSILDVAEVGHESISTTETYLELGTKVMIEAVEKVEKLIFNPAGNSLMKEWENGDVLMRLKELIK